MKRIQFAASLMICLLTATLFFGCAGSTTAESTGEYVDDAIITTKVKAELAGDKIVSLLDLTVETFKGVVQLSGFVNNVEQASEAVTVAGKVKGVKEVKNSLIIKGK